MSARAGRRAVRREVVVDGRQLGLAAVCHSVLVALASGPRRNLRISYCKMITSPYLVVLAVCLDTGVVLSYYQLQRNAWHSEHSARTEKWEQMFDEEVNMPWHWHLVLANSAISERVDVPWGGKGCGQGTF